MAILETSGVSTFNATAVDLLTAALRIAQVIGAEEPATGAQLANGLESFNLLVKQIQASGAHVWLQEEGLLFLQPGQYRYQIGAGSPDHACLFADLTQTALAGAASSGDTSLDVSSIAGIGNGNTIGVVLISGSIFWTTVDGTPSGSSVPLTDMVPSAGAAIGALVFDYPTPLARPLKCSGARRYTYASGAEIPVNPMSRLDFANLTTKAATGTPQQWFFDPQTGQNVYSQLIAIMNVNPAPANATLALRFTAQRPIQDFSNLANLPDFPAEWLNGLKWWLAMEIGPEYGVPQEQMAIIKMIADPKKDQLIAWDQEAQGTTVFPYPQAVFQLIAGALRLCGGCGPQDVPTLGQIENGLLTLNAMMQAWQASGMHVWTQETAAFVPGLSTAQYTIGTGQTINVVRPLKLSGARLVITSTQEAIPLIPMSRWDYANLSGKTAPPGPPSQIFYDPQFPVGIVTLFPAPDAATVAGATVNMTMQRPITTLANLSGSIDFPDEWQSALRFNLAVELAPEYKCPPEQYSLLKKIADEKLAVVSKWDVEQQGTSTLPFPQPVYQVIARALRLCNAVGPQDVPSLGLVNNAFISFNAMIQQWQATGIHVWCEEEAILYAQPGQVLYAIGNASPDHATLFNSSIQTALGTTALASATALVLESAAGIKAGDNIGIQLDAGTNFWTTVVGPPSGDTVTIATALPSQATSAAIVFDYTAPLIRPLRVYGGRRWNYSSKIDIPMLIMARLDYEAQPNKYTPGVITQFFFDPQTSPTPFGSSQQGSALLNLWPNPADDTFGFRFTAQRPIQTLADLNASADFPVEWFNALCFNLAVELWPEYGVDPAAEGGAYGAYGAAIARANSYQSVRILAQEKLQIAQGWDREPESIMFGVAMAPGYRRG